MNYLYLIVDIAAFIVPFLFSFHPKIKFYKEWKFVWTAIITTTLLFSIWDNYFTKIGVWGFNERYLSGYYLSNLPVEEILFFVCIPYACLFTYFCFKLFYGDHYRLKYEKRITLFIIVLSTVCALFSVDKLYTFYATAGLALFLSLLQFKVKVKWLSIFFYSHMFLLIPFFIVNGILTGTGLDEPVVWYNDNEIIGPRMHTIPVEDVFYGMLMLLFSTFLFEFGKSLKGTDSETAEG